MPYIFWKNITLFFRRLWNFIKTGEFKTKIESRLYQQLHDFDIELTKLRHNLFVLNKKYDNFKDKRTSAAVAVRKSIEKVKEDITEVTDMVEDIKETLWKKNF